MIKLKIDLGDDRKIVLKFTENEDEYTCVMSKEMAEDIMTLYPEVVENE